MVFCSTKKEECLCVGVIEVISDDDVLERESSTKQHTGTRTVRDDVVLMMNVT